jgi:hypothetical protein
MDGWLAGINGLPGQTESRSAGDSRGRRASATVVLENVMASSVIYLAILTIH